MRDKNGCLNCHFLSLIFIGYDGTEIGPLPDEYRNRDGFLKLLQKLDRRIHLVKCFHGNWDASKIGIKNTAEIENAAFRKDRGKKCTSFSAYDSHATLEAVMERNRRQEEVIDRKVTRRMAWIAIIVSALATLFAAVIPHILTR